MMQNNEAAEEIKFFIDNFDNEMNKQISNSITFLRDWMVTDLNELKDDTTSDYAEFILANHEHIRNAIFHLEGILDPTHGYAD